MDMATLVNAPRSIRVGDRTFLVSALTQYEWGCHQAWIKDFVPRPPIPDDADNVMKSLYRRAWPPAIGSRLWWDALDHPGCFAAFVRLALGKHQPGMSEEEALVLAMLICEESAVMALILRCLGSESEPGDLPAPADPDEEKAADRPESDDPGEMYYKMIAVLRFSKSDVEAMTFPQMRYYSHKGRPPRRGTRSYGSSSAARAAMVERVNRVNKAGPDEGGTRS